MTSFLFPGQGSQRPGMGKDYFDSAPAAREVFDKAARLAPEGFLQTVFDGTDEAVSDTRVAQPALLTVDVAIARHLMSLGHGPSVCAGHSLGEYAALVIAESLDFDDAFRLVEVRARLMFEGVPEGGMAAIVGMSPEAIEAALPPGAEIANYNGPQQTIISGTLAGLKEAERILTAQGAKRFLRLPVSGPFHSSCMREAAEKFSMEVEKIAIHAPEVKFISSVTGDAIGDPDAIREALAAQMRGPVRWTDVMKRTGPGRAIESGPGRVLQGIAKRIEGAPEVVCAGTLAEGQGIGIV